MTAAFGTGLEVAGDRSPLGALVRLFVHGQLVDVTDVASALPLADAAPLLRRDGDRVAAAVDLVPYADDDHDWFVVSDRTVDAQPTRTDHVLGVGRAATTLAQLTVRRPVAHALDLGTGCGVQSLHLSTHCEQVTATDVVPRALSFAATTFALSELDVETKLGDLTAPVVGRSFDLVVCNPPFVVGPDQRFAYRDGVAAHDADDDADGMSRRAVRAAADVLAEGGVAHVLVNWLHRTDEDWRDRVARWVADLGCDAWIVQRDVQAADDYARTWLDDVGDRSDASVQRWLRWFAERRIDAVGLGWVLLRRTASPHRIAVEEILQETDQPLGPHLLGWLERTEWLRTMDDEALLSTRFVVPTGVYVDDAQRLCTADGFRWSLPSDEPTAALLAACDGSRDLSVVVAILEAATGIGAAELQPAVCALVRGLVDRGFVLPVRSAPSA